MEKFLEKIINDNSYYNFSSLPFDYKAFLKQESILKQLVIIKKSGNEEKESNKNKLQKIIYTELYKLNFDINQVKEYFQKAILTPKFKNYLGMAFKFSLQYNEDDDPYLTTFIHLAQFFIADLCYEFLWKIENESK